MGLSDQSEAERTVVIVNQLGLHARASAKFVRCVEKFDAEVQVIRGNDSVIGASILDLLSLAAGPGTSLTIRATGRQAQDAVDAAVHLVESKFDEE